MVKVNGGVRDLELAMTKITADKMLNSGYAMARTDSGVVFVEGLLPGETGEVESAGKKGGIPFYTTTKVVSPSEDRREPNCKHYGECGGCNWLHMSYGAQLKAKRDIFDDALRRIGKIDKYPEPEIFSAEEFGYRQRIQFKVDRKTGTVGFFKRGSNEVVEIESCPLLTDSLNTLLDERSLIADRAKEVKRGLMAIDTGDSLISIPSLESKTVTAGEINVGKFTFKVKGDSFFQSNKFLIETMGNWCSEELSGDKLLDLFGGVGLFSLFHGERFNSTVLVEMSKPMARAAQKGFIANGFTTGKALGMKSEQFFGKAKANEFDSVIVDPPRDGLTKEVREGVLALQPKQILYISCNPATQARDLSFWLKNGYILKRTALFDLYPNTSHLESGAFLVRGEE